MLSHSENLKPVVSISLILNLVRYHDEADRQTDGRTDRITVACRVWNG